ncbi:MAG: hypothetical protein J6Y02_04410 [Pseudobutyrivibrio sp.]|nr:hypothetical protein [Pseudobutyrivibrio sp.]
MTYKAGSSHYFVSSVWKEEILYLKDKTEEWHTAKHPPFDDEGFYNGYKTALEDMLEFAERPISGGPD